MREVAAVLPSRRRLHRTPRVARWTCVVVVLGLVYLVAATIGPLLAPHDPDAVGGIPLAPPSGEYLLGTDQLGRDLASRMIAAAQVNVLAGVESVAIALVAGGALGVIAAYCGRVVDTAVLRFADYIFSFPEFLLGIIVVAALGPGLWHATLAIGIVYTPRFIRVARGEAVSVMRSSYVEAARLARRSGLYIVVRHVLPNIATPMIVLTALSMSTAQLTYASLSFLGFGARPPRSDFGQMLAEARSYMVQDPLLVLAPAIALALLIFGFNLLGDILRDRLDPRMSRHSA